MLLRRLGVLLVIGQLDRAFVGSDAWPSSATSSPGTRCWSAGARTSGSCARRCEHARVAAARRAARPSCTRTCGAALRAARHRLPLEPPGRGARVRVRSDDDRHDRAPRRASRCASSCRRCEMLSTRRRRARALYLYPSKALAQDQARSLHAFGHQAHAAGDLRRRHAARAARRAAPARQRRADQPGHAARRDPAQPPGVGATSSRNLAVVVVDEAHVYRGVFGSHVANVLRRLRRICELHGTAPRFLLASATVANPGELASRLTGLDDVHGDRRATARRAPSARSRCGTRR